MESPFVRTQDVILEKTENEVAAVLVHKTELLRLRNRLHSPLLRLPVETFIHVLSYIMGGTEHPRVWRPIFSTCYGIHIMMCTTSELWRKANFTVDRVAYCALERSTGNIQEITANLQAWGGRKDEWTQNVLDFCRDNLVLHGYMLHTVNLCGLPSDMAHWSWIFERPLPRLHNLKIHFYPLDDRKGDSLSTPVVLQLPTDLPLRVLDIRNATLPWSSNLFTGLTELHLAFGDCGTFVEISEGELLGILASPQLERLSLEDLMPKIPVIDGRQEYTPTRIARLPSLTFLKLDNLPDLVGYILSHMDIPAIVSFEVRTLLSAWEAEQCLEWFFPDDRLSSRLFPDPPVFEVWPDSGDGMWDSLKVKIGGAKIQFDFDMDEAENYSNAIMSCIHPLVPPSVTTLRLDHSGLDEEEWVEFFGSHPKVRSIECTKSAWGPVSESLWDALSPDGAHGIPLCPLLESISVFNDPAYTPLLNCPRNRKNAGYELRYLKLWGVGDELAGEFRLLVEELQVFSKPIDPCEKVRFISLDEPGTR